ncbi:MAG: hypothetical protein KJ787_13470 [Gammaproteobacteria bacterium]|nr:hypothetical protein [Gammaproteobacteria bacterium]MBU1647335.1 hypothetical protein [Gammaproteobacteria bacterium]MBU1973127.1 hypothetical protein [Gammaproteobacteria bacterium]
MANLSSIERRKLERLLRMGGFTFAPQNGLNNEYKVFASISSKMSERVSPLNPKSKRS